MLFRSIPAVLSCFLMAILAVPGLTFAQATGSASGDRNASAVKIAGRVPARFMGKFTTADWSTYFGGVLLIRKESAPVFESFR